MITSIVWYKGDLRCQMVHQNSGEIVLTDAPLDNNGKGEAFSPTDLLASSLVSCMITIMALRAEKSDFRLNKVEADMIKTMASNPRRVSKIEVNLKIENLNFTEPQKEILMKAALSCPVALSLHLDIEQIVDFKFV